MNKIPLNIAGLDGGVIIKKGGGGGVTINNQEKSVDITENGTTEVTADAGFTGLSKVIVNTNVASSGGGGGSDMPVIGDGKTYLYITIAAEGRMDVPLYFQQTKANGVTIDWGDGSPTETLSGTGNKNTTHKYAAIGDYVISLDPVDGCTIGLGHNSMFYCVMGSIEDAGKVYRNMLRAVEIGKNFKSNSGYAFYGCSSLASVIIPDDCGLIYASMFYGCSALASVVIPDSVTNISNEAFRGCSSLASVVIPDSVTSIYSDVFNGCSSLASVVIPNRVTSIGQRLFNGCSSLASVVIPDSVTNISSQAFNGCYGMAFYDFSNCTSVPSLSNTNAFTNIPSDCKIIVPDALYDTWIAATNWSSSASYIIKKSDWDAQS